MIARWVQWDKTKWHIQRDGEAETVCGRDVPQRARTTHYHPMGCERCKRDEAAHEAAESARRALYDERQKRSDDNLAENRAGKFIVARCKVCGLQHLSLPRQGAGVPFCMGERPHESDLEVIAVEGPAWVPA